jgi:hypothetical protein
MGKYNTDLCDDTMTFSDCELAILREAVKTSEENQSRKIANTPEMTAMIKILEGFLRKKRLICYGGTAINNILPKHAQFYDRDIEVPDYDFYSPHALDDAKELADLFNEHGFDEIEAKAGVHFGTYKVYVDFIPIADITFLHPTIFKSISREAIQIDGILYSPPNFLRMNMYLELSRPEGDVSRWEKIYKRLVLLNKFFPFHVDANCGNIEFQRPLEHHKDKSDDIYYKVRDVFINEEVVFFGGYAVRLYSRYMSKGKKEVVKKIPDFDVLAEDPERCANILMERLRDKSFKKIYHKGIGEIIPERIEIRIGKDTLAFIYKPIACHSYNVIKLEDREIRVATIDTMLSFYFAFYYSGEPYYTKDRILCMAKFLFDVEYKNRLEQKGILKRFSVNCYGKQVTLDSIRAEKTEKFNELKHKRGTREYDEWFLKYSFSNKENEPERTKDKESYKYIKKGKKKHHKRTRKMRQYEPEEELPSVLLPPERNNRRGTRKANSTRGEYLF